MAERRSRNAVVTRPSHSASRSLYSDHEAAEDDDVLLIEPQRSSSHHGLCEHHAHHYQPHHHGSFSPPYDEDVDIVIEPYQDNEPPEQSSSHEHVRTHPRRARRRRPKTKNYGGMQTTPVQVGSELYEQKIQDKYEELKKLIVSCLDPQMLSPLVKQQASQLVQQYHLRPVTQRERISPRRNDRSPRREQRPQRVLQRSALRHTESAENVQHRGERSDSLQMSTKKVSFVDDRHTLPQHDSEQYRGDQREEKRSVGAESRWDDAASENYVYDDDFEDASNANDIQEYRKSRQHKRAERSVSNSANRYSVEPQLGRPSSRHVNQQRLSTMNRKSMSASAPRHSAVAENRYSQTYPVHSDSRDLSLSGSASPTSRSPVRATGAAGFHLKYTAGGDVKKWLQRKNREECRQRKEKRRAERARRRERKEQELEKEEKRRQSDELVKIWMEEKKQEELMRQKKENTGKICRVENTQKLPTDVTGERVKMEEKDHSASLAKPKPRLISTNANPSAKGPKQISSNRKVPLFSRPRNYNSFPGGSTWLPPGKKMTEFERRKAYDDWVKRNLNRSLELTDEEQAPTHKDGADKAKEDRSTVVFAPKASSRLHVPYPPSAKHKMQAARVHSAPSQSITDCREGLVNGTSNSRRVVARVTTAKGVRRERRERPEPQGADHSEMAEVDTTVSNLRSSQDEKSFDKDGDAQGHAYNHSFSHDSEEKNHSEIRESYTDHKARRRGISRRSRLDLNEHEPSEDGRNSLVKRTDVSSSRDEELNHETESSARDFSREDTRPKQHGSERNELFTDMAKDGDEKSAHTNVNSNVNERTNSEELQNVFGSSPKVEWRFGREDTIFIEPKEQELVVGERDISAGISDLDVGGSYDEKNFESHGDNGKKAHSYSSDNDKERRASDDLNDENYGDPMANTEQGDGVELTKSKWKELVDGRSNSVHGHKDVDAGSLHGDTEIDAEPKDDAGENEHGVKREFAENDLGSGSFDRDANIRSSSQNEPAVEREFCRGMFDLSSIISSSLQHCRELEDSGRTQDHSDTRALPTVPADGSEENRHSVEEKNPRIRITNHDDVSNVAAESGSLALADTVDDDDNASSIATSLNVSSDFDREG